MDDKDYLGDAVYVDFDGFSITLTTKDGRQVTNTIILEPNTLSALYRYVSRMQEKYGKVDSR